MPSAPTGLSAVLLILRKELREALRDRSMVIQLLLLPLFLYPLLGFGAYQVYLMLQGASEGQVEIAWVDSDAPDDVEDLIRDALRKAGRDSVPDADKYLFLPTPAELDRADAPGDPELFSRLRAEFERAGGDRPLALLSWWADGDSLHAAICYDSSNDRSDDMRELLQGGVRSYAHQLGREGALALGIGKAEFEVFRIESSNTATANQTGRYLLSILLPIFLMSMLSHGTFYSALDTVVGERERSTMETLWSAPLSRSTVLVGKLIFVVISTLVTFTLNMLSLFLFLSFALQLVRDQLPPQLNLDFSVPLTSILILVGAVLLLSITLAALMMLLALPAKTYREGQAVLTPVHLVVAFSSFAAIGTGQTMHLDQALIPLINVVMLCKTVIGGEYSLSMVWISYGVLALLGVVSMLLARRLVGHEGVFFDPTLNLKRLLRGGFKQ